jgi:glycosyl transferase family 25
MDDLIARGVYDPKRARRLHRLGREMNLGQIACALSHIAVWRQVAAGPHRRVLVLEDDAVPVQEIATVGDTLAELPPSWELLYLGYNRNEVVTPRLRANQIAYMCLAAFRIGSLSVREASNLLPRPHSARLRRAGFHDETHAYALTPAAAERLLRFQRPIGLNVDSAITRVILREEIEAYVADPKVFYQSGAASLIHAADPGGRPGGTRAEAHSPWVAPAG